MCNSSFENHGMHTILRPHSQSNEEEVMMSGNWGKESSSDNEYIETLSNRILDELNSHSN